MRKLMLTFDLEEFVTPKEVGMEIDEKMLFDISVQGLDNLISILDKHPEVKCTFFTTWQFASYAENYVVKLINKGHEIALHGLKHNINLFTMDKQEVKSELFEAKKNLEKKFGIKIIGFRAPQMKILDLNILADIGIKYDSSLHPTYVPGRSNNFFSSRNTYFYNGVLEVPASVTPLFKLPFSWVWFRNIGLNYSKICTNLSFFNQDFVNIYFHPWDFVDLNVEPFKGKIMNFILRNTGDKMMKQFDQYLYWCENKFDLITIGEYFKIKNGN